MKIDSKDFRVRHGDKVKLKKWPTIIETFLQNEKGVSKTSGKAR
jgi:hypothetical protein